MYEERRRAREAVPQLWLTCPECEAERALRCEVLGPLPEHLRLVEQTCRCDPPDELWYDVWEEALGQLGELGEERP
jgi:hypothetical protein